MKVTDATVRKKVIVKTLERLGSLSLSQLQLELNPEISRTTLNRYIDELESEGKVVAVGSGKNTKYQVISVTGDSDDPSILDLGKRMIDIEETKPDDDDPLVEVRVMNPLAFLKKWLTELLKNEGIEVKLSIKLKPLTVLGIVLLLTTAGLGAKALGLAFKYTPFYESYRQLVTEPDTSRQAAFDGQIIVSDNQAYIVRVGEAEAVRLIGELDWQTYDRGFVFVTGRYNPDTQTLQEVSIQELE
jgi:biotin operon repressor